VQVHPKINRISILWDVIEVDINLYLINSLRNAVIDTGPPQLGHEAVSSFLKTTDSNLSGIDFILNTHGHLDHVGDNVAIKAAFKAQTAIHKDDAFFLEDYERSFDEYFGPPIEALKGKERMPGLKKSFLDSCGVKPEIDRRLEDNDMIDLGGGVELRVIHLPGHSPGSAGFYWEKEGILFSGDSVPGLHTISGELPIITDFPAYERSVKRLMGMPVRSLFCGHPYRGISLPPCEHKKGDEVKQFLQDSLDIVHLIGDTVGLASSVTQRTLPEITSEVLGRLPAEMGFKPLSGTSSKSFSLNTVFWCLRTLHNVKV
jgi:glyoxylase-like metal-dependent hydrolase (beta-lactamase superfamily II)